MHGEKVGKIHTNTNVSYIWVGGFQVILFSSFYQSVFSRLGVSKL